MQYNAYEIVESLVSFVNGLDGAPYQYRATLSFSDDDISLPLTNTTMSFHCKKNSITHLTDEETASTCEHHETYIAMTCFAPYEDDSVNITRVCETVLSEIYFDFSIKMKRYTVGEIEIDEDLRSFRLDCEIYFEFDTVEQS